MRWVTTLCWRTSKSCAGEYFIGTVGDSNISLATAVQKSEPLRKLQYLAMQQG